MWTSLKRISAPLDDVVSLSEIKASLRVYTNDDDALLRRLIAAATASIEGPEGIGITLLTQTWQLTLDAFPAGPIALPDLGKIWSASIDYHTDPTGNLMTVEEDDRYVSFGTGTGVLCPVTTWPTAARRPGAVKINIICGYGPFPEDVPQDLVQAIHLMVAHWYQHDGAATETRLSPIPMGVESILNRYRRIGVA